MNNPRSKTAEPDESESQELNVKHDWKVADELPSEASRGCHPCMRTSGHLSLHSVQLLDSAFILPFNVTTQVYRPLDLHHTHSSLGHHLCLCLALKGPTSMPQSLKTSAPLPFNTLCLSLPSVNASKLPGPRLGQLDLSHLHEDYSRIPRQRDLVFGSGTRNKQPKLLTSSRLKASR